MLYKKLAPCFKRFGHWTPRYVKDRLTLMKDEMLNPSCPWLTKDAITFIDAVLKPTDIGIEFGAGRSTVWLAQRLGRLISIEHDAHWLITTKYKLFEKDLLRKVDISLCTDPRQFSRAAIELEDSSIDFCLVDGEERDSCAVAILPKLKPGAVLVIDNVDRYLPSQSKTYNAVTSYASNLWKTFDLKTEDWRRVWTTNGITDTCIWLKPA